MRGSSPSERRRSATSTLLAYIYLIWTKEIDASLITCPVIALNKLRMLSLVESWLIDAAFMGLMMSNFDCVEPRMY